MRQWKRVINHEMMNDCDLCEIYDFCDTGSCREHTLKLTGIKINGALSVFLINESLKKLKERRF